jgi:23S rRNA (cytosine1962-C5)-methyltransferase
MPSFRFRAPGTPHALLALLVRALPSATEAALGGAVRGGLVRVDGRVVREPGLSVAPGTRVAGVLPDGKAPPFAPLLRLRGPDFAALESGPGWREPETGGVGPQLAELLEADPADVFPVLPGDPDAHALWLVALGEPARDRLEAALSRALLAGDGGREERALAVALPWRRGSLESDASVSLRFETVAERDGIAELALFPGTLPAAVLRETLARSGAAVLGDVRFGGRLVAGGLRLWTARLALPDEGIDVACEAPKDAWPDEPVFPADAGRGARSGDAAELLVSRATLRAVSRGHPWILADTETGDAGRFRAGALVALRSPEGERGGLARVEGEGAVAARIWSRGEAARDGGSVESRIATALARRSALSAGAEAEDGTDAYRLVHGEGDGLPGLAIDRLGSCLRVLVTGRACEQVATRAVDAVLRGLALGADPPVVEVLHLRERPAGALECVRLARGALPAALYEGSERLVVRERGLRFEVDLGLGDPNRSSPGVGLFLDQRENRARLAARARGGRWLNLFAHTGAFTVALLAAGAAEVVSVDLSAAWLRWLEQTLARNGLDAARGPCVRGDSRRWLERLPEGERFDGIVLDPPTAAAAGRRFWSVRRDLEPMVEASLARLAPRGCLLVCRNDRGGGRELAALVQRAATRAGVTLRDTRPAPPGADFPTLAAFPEGDPFEGVLAERAGD